MDCVLQEFDDETGEDKFPFLSLLCFSTSVIYLLFPVYTSVLYSVLQV